MTGAPFTARGLSGLPELARRGDALAAAAGAPAGLAARVPALLTASAAADGFDEAAFAEVARGLDDAGRGVPPGVAEGRLAPAALPALAPLAGGAARAIARVLGEELLREGVQRLIAAVKGRDLGEVGRLGRELLEDADSRMRSLVEATAAALAGAGGDGAAVRELMGELLDALREIIDARDECLRELLDHAAEQAESALCEEPVRPCPEVVAADPGPVSPACAPPSCPPAAAGHPAPAPAPAAVPAPAPAPSVAPVATTPATAAPAPGPLPPIASAAVPAPPDAPAVPAAPAAPPPTEPGEPADGVPPASGGVGEPDAPTAGEDECPIRDCVDATAGLLGGVAAAAAGGIAVVADAVADAVADFDGVPDCPERPEAPEAPAAAGPDASMSADARIDGHGLLDLSMPEADCPTEPEPEPEPAP
ncbi:MAG: hypothetical protein Q4P43_02590, partial [Corynebacterium sphenisci]|nr:hypothetical protein [Corynebacterium sphenisci]